MMRCSWVLGVENGLRLHSRSRDINLHHSRAVEMPAAFAALALLVLCRQDFEPLFVVFRPGNPSGFDSGGLRLASEVKRVCV